MSEMDPDIPTTPEPPVAEISATVTFTDVEEVAPAEEPTPSTIDEPVKVTEAPIDTPPSDQSPPERKQTVEDDNSEQINSRRSRELKQLLALSKEANLDTNIPRKRKPLETPKIKEFRSITLEAQNKAAKAASEAKPIRFPVTAEAELEQEIGSEINLPVVVDHSSPSRIIKRKRDSESSLLGGATEEAVKRNRKVSAAELKMFKANKDMFCWRCHRDGVNIACETCPRTYHQKCLKQTIHDTEHWPCPECVSILKAESTQTRSKAMKGMTLEHLCSLLKFAIKRMIQCQGSEPFMHEVSDTEFPEYKKYIVNPMDLSKLERNIKNNVYGSTQAFEADAKWLLHNSIIFNSYQSKLTSTVKTIVKICKQEMAEIENCPNCYLNANTKKNTWFVEVCPKPHILLWAKLKGFPYWPAKAMQCNSSGMVDVRFFGAHDRAWVHYKDCYLYSEKDPNTFKQKRYDIEKCIEELNLYVDNLKAIYGEYKSAPFKTLYEPDNEVKQLCLFLPRYKAVKLARKKQAQNGEVNSDPPKAEDGGGTQTDPDKCDDSSKTTDNNNKDDTKSDDTFSNMSSPVHDKENHDTTMEGYGTDDDAATDIDLERRKRYCGKKSEGVDDEEEEEEEDDTQVPNSASADASSTGNARTSPGKLKLLPRQTEQETLKRISTEDVSLPQQKVSRRNSDQSVKSDSSRISNLSDKINRVDITENMEVSLGDDDVSCVSITGKSSPVSSDVSKSGSEVGVEIKKKPVQVDIDNAEFTISPTNKLKISDKLIKRLSDSSDSNADNEKIEEAKRDLALEKSHTDMLLERYKSVVEHKVVDFSGDEGVKASSTSRTDDADVGKESHEKTGEVQDTTTSDAEEDVPINIPGTDMSRQGEGIEDDGSVKVKSRDQDKAEDVESGNSETVEVHQLKKAKVMIQPSIKEFTRSASPLKKVDDTPKKPADASTGKSSTEDTEPELDPLAADEDQQIRMSKTRIFNIIHSSLKDDVDKRHKTKGELKDLSSGGVLAASPKVQNGTSENRVEFPESTDGSQRKKVGTGSRRNSSVTPENKLSPEKNVSSKANQELEKATNKKRKMSGEDDTVQCKVIKITKDGPSQPVTQLETVPLNMELSQDEIKSEPESEEEVSDSENLEEKRKYLSALNISEKVVKQDQKKNKVNEIRTRSKAEEKREKYRVLDNVSKVIDEVAIGSKEGGANRRITCEKKKESDPVQTSVAPSQQDPGEIYVKSFAKLQTVSCTTPPPNQQRARKSFPVPMYANPRAVVSMRKEGPTTTALVKKDPPKSTAQPHSSGVHTIVMSKPINTTSTACSKTLTKISTTSGAPVVIHSPQTQKQIPDGSGVSSGLPSGVSQIILFPSSAAGMAGTGYPFIAAVPSIVSASSSPSTGCVVSPVMTTPVLQPMPTNSGNGNENAPISVLKPNLRASQNYTAHKELDKTTMLESGQSHQQGGVILNDLLSQPINQLAALASSTQQGSRIDSTNSTNQSDGTAVENISGATVPEPESSSATLTASSANRNSDDDEFAVLNSVIPENLSRSVSQLLLKPPPRLKPRPPGILGTAFDEGVPSTAGSVTDRVNSVAHRMGDYFRGMLIETLEELGKASNQEAKITSLQLEIEALKHRHNIEMTEMRNNICTILKDIQKSLAEDRERIIDETRAACEAETIRRVELAKSKQWCANCSKEAQFYCCWNTSYCDYPCQQKHWPQHMGKCTQHMEKTGGGVSMVAQAAGAAASGGGQPQRPPGTQQLILRPAGPGAVPGGQPKPGVGRYITKPTKVYMNKTPVQQKTFKTLTTTGNHITVIETSPGNFELVGNGPIAVAGKYFTAAPGSALQPVKYKGNVVSSPRPTASTPGTSKGGQQPVDGEN